MIGLDLALLLLSALVPVATALRYVEGGLGLSPQRSLGLSIAEILEICLDFKPELTGLRTMGGRPALCPADGFSMSLRPPPQLPAPCRSLPALHPLWALAAPYALGKPSAVSPCPPVVNSPL